MDPTRNSFVEGGGTGQVRRPLVDAARGLAVLAMVVFHTTWDLSDLRLIELEIGLSPGWQWFARVIAASFLTLVGIGLALASRSGRGTRAFWRRVGVVAGAALLITLATRVATPDAFIFFGVLHNIALSSVLALPLLPAPVAAVWLAALAMWAAPLLLAGPVFDMPALLWTGLGTVPPETNDFVPVFPWTGFVFAGLAAARIWAGRMRDATAPSGPPSRPVALLAAIGRRSLVIYLLHQPLIFGGLSALVELTGPNPRAEASPFLRTCRESCMATGHEAGFCERSCGCTVDTLRREDIWQALLHGRPTADQFNRYGEIARQCLATPPASN